MELVNLLITAGLFFAAETRVDDASTQHPPGIPAVFIMPADAGLGVDTEAPALPPWLRPRDFDI